MLTMTQLRGTVAKASLRATKWVWSSVEPSSLRKEATSLKIVYFKDENEKNKQKKTHVKISDNFEWKKIVELKKSIRIESRKEIRNILTSNQCTLKNKNKTKKSNILHSKYGGIHYSILKSTLARHAWQV